MKIDFEKALNLAKPEKGQKNDKQYLKLKALIPSELSDSEYNNYIKMICDKIKY